MICSHSGEQYENTGNRRKQGAVRKGTQRNILGKHGILGKQGERITEVYFSVKRRSEHIMGGAALLAE